MIKLNTQWTLFVIIVMTSMLITGTTLAGLVLAVKKSGSSVKTIHKTSSTAAAPAAHVHFRGVKLLSAHTIPSKIAVGTRFSIGVTVFNNSSATITFGNGTCTSSPSPLSITFNGNAMIKSQASAATTPCKAQQVTLKPGERSQITSPSLSAITYVATAPGTTNGTMIFKYGVETATSKSPISDTTSRTYAFDILQSAGPKSTTTTTTTTNSQPGPAGASPSIPSTLAPPTPPSAKNAPTGQGPQSIIPLN